MDMDKNLGEQAATALHTLSRSPSAADLAKRLECGAFTAAFLCAGTGSLNHKEIKASAHSSAASRVP